jgi:hypothetical protein
LSPVSCRKAVCSQNRPGHVSRKKSKAAGCALGACVAGDPRMSTIEGRQMSKRRQLLINQTNPPAEKRARDRGSWESVLSHERLKAELERRKELSDSRSALERRLVVFRSLPPRDLPIMQEPIPPSKPVLMLLNIGADPVSPTPSVSHAF